MSGTCRIAVMGRFHVEVAGRAVPARAWHDEGAAVVKLLALELSHRLPRSRVTARLWPEADTRTAGRRLDRAVRSACKALGSPRGVTLDGDHVQLWPTGPLVVDLQQFEVAARRAGTERGAREALELYGGELLPDDLAEPWTEPHRAQVRESRLRLLAMCGSLPGVVDLEPTRNVLTELEALRPR